jgi:FkbM family methyltransferase
LVPPGKDFLFHKYLKDMTVCINTVYPIETRMLTGTYEPDISAIIERFVGQDSVVIDVGANVGALTLLMAKTAKCGRVIAVEPGPTICSRLRRNIDLNPELQSIVDVFQVGISDKIGELFWKEDANNRGNAGLLGHDGQSVRVDTLDHIVDSAHLTKIDFIKIDVEGMEYEVIKSGMASILKYRPLICYETLDAFREFRGFDIYGEIFSRLCNIGYKHFAILPKGKTVEVSNLDVLCSANVLAVPQEKIGAKFK